MVIRISSSRPLCSKNNPKSISTINKMTSNWPLIFSLDTDKSTDQPIDKHETDMHLTSNWSNALVSLNYQDPPFARTRTDTRGKHMCALHVLHKSIYTYCYRLIEKCPNLRSWIDGKFEIKCKEQIRQIGKQFKIGGEIGKEKDRSGPSMGKPINT